MAIKVGVLTGEGWTKIDNNIVKMKELSDKGIRLYIYIAMQKNGFNIREGKIVEALGWSSRTIRRYKKELSDHDLILMDKHQYTHRLWVGNTKKGASAVRRDILEEEGCDVSEDISEAQGEYKASMKRNKVQQVDG